MLLLGLALSHVFEAEITGLSSFYETRQALAMCMSFCHICDRRRYTLGWNFYPCGDNDLPENCSTEIESMFLGFQH